MDQSGLRRRRNATHTEGSTLPLPTPPHMERHPSSCHLTNLTLSLALLLTCLAASLQIHRSLPLQFHSFTTQPITAHPLQQLYDPIENRQLLEQRLAHPCNVSLPNPAQIRNHPYIPKWPLSRFAAYHNIMLYLNHRWADRTPSDPKIHVLDAGGSLFLEPFHHLINITKTEYPGSDLHRTSFPDESFDLIATDQLLEHAFFPFMVFVEMRRILRKGGLAVVTTVAYNPLHEAKNFHDLWRFMLDGLRVLSMPFEGGIKVCGSWGNANAISVRAKEGMASPNETKNFTENFAEHLANNDNVNPFLVWIVVEK